MGKYGRNQPCPCGSGKKYKHCHGNPLDPKPLPGEQPQGAPQPLPPQIQAMFRDMQARDKRRKDSQGFGRPIISTDFKGHKVVAVGSTVHFSEKWIYFPDFLTDFIKTKIGGDWGNAEIAKPFEERHPLMQWYHLVCEFQQGLEKDENGHMNSEATGLVNCYYGLAYNLYLLEHNAELQQRYIDRLKQADQFQGAYYELMVASCMIRAGFKLELEDEADQEQKHCEFSATSTRTRKKYWVEAKMRSVAGILGKTEADGQPATSKPTSRLSTHIKEAFAKPADGERIIFVDVNTGPMTREDFQSTPPKTPKWMDAAERQLGDRERNLKEGQSAYVFVTNMSFHNSLDETFLGQAVLTFGLGIDDYGKPRTYTFPESWRIKQKHQDLFAIEEALKKYPQIPNTFDDDLPPVADGDRERIKIGRLYNFEDAGVIGEVTSASVVEPEKRIYIVVSGQDGKGHILSEDISDRELEVYRQHKETYFGVIQEVGKELETPYELFEWMMETYKNTSKEKLLEWMKDAQDFEELKKLDQLDLALTYCERCAISASRDSAKNKPG